MSDDKIDFSNKTDRDLLIHLCTEISSQREQISSLKESLNIHLSHHWACYLAVGTIILGYFIAT